MKIWELIKEITSHYFKQFMKTLKERGWKKNLFMIPFILAIVAVVLILFGK